jgi:hypothetical protein
MTKRVFDMAQYIAIERRRVLPTSPGQNMRFSSSEEEKFYRTEKCICMILFFGIRLFLSVSKHLGLQAKQF